MACVYIDTSALAKWYLPEARSEEFSDWIRQQKDTCISSVTVTELRCLLARRRRMKELTDTQIQKIYACFQQDIRDGHLRRCQVMDKQIQTAALLIDSLPAIALRTLDALHLNIARDIPAETLATADRVMIAAARALRFQVVCFD